MVGYRLPPAGAQRSWLFSPSPPPPPHTPSAWSPEDAAALSSPLQSETRWKGVRPTVEAEACVCVCVCVSVCVGGRERVSDLHVL